MNIQESASLLKSQLSSNDWLFDVIPTEKELIILSYYMNGEILTSTPSTFEGYRVLLHYANKPKPVTQQLNIIIEEDISELDADALIYKLDQLELICGPNILQNIFHEIHEGENATTNLSTKYPDVRKELEELYTTYGFDVLYSEITID